MWLRSTVVLALLLSVNKSPKYRRLLRTWWESITNPITQIQWGKLMKLVEQIDLALEANSLTLESIQTDFLTELQTDVDALATKIQALIDKPSDATNSELEPLLLKAQAQSEKIGTLQSALSALKNTVDAVDEKLEETGQELPPIEVPPVDEEEPPPVEGAGEEGPAAERYVGFAKGKKK